MEKMTPHLFGCTRSSAKQLATITAAALFLSLYAAPTDASPVDEAEAASYLDRLPEDEIVYFVLPDRFANGDASNDTGGLEGDRLDHGFDPTHKGFYHGGDLKGLTSKLDYIEGLGATAIWLGPIYQNKPVQGGPGQESAGYHGYWITDFTNVDPHFGTREDLKEFVDGAHARGMKIYLDIITNHTADVIAYRECHDPDFDPSKRVQNGCPYRSKADYPYQTVGNAKGRRINRAFEGDHVQSVENFEKLTRYDYAYTPFIPAGEESSKHPAWLNDLKFYHNRGDTTFQGESSLYGDFVGLDDLMTEDPRVVDGFIEIFGNWISDFRIDGFRVDTARHVNPEFWRAFIPAMHEKAAAEGIPNFYVFGESYIEDAALLARETHVSEFPAVLDFPLWDVSRKVIAGKEAPELIANRYKTDLLFKGGFQTAKALPVFTGNHDAGRLGGYIQDNNPDMTGEELTARIRLGHALLFFGRGVPVIYYGDEQGFTGDGGDQDAREDMFPSLVEVYNDNRLAGTTKTTAEDNFDADAPLYRAFAEMGALFKSHAALRRGTQETRLAETASGGVFAFSRFDPETDAEYLVVLNFGVKDRTMQIEVDGASEKWRSVAGRCAARTDAPGSYKVSVKALDYIVCRAGK